MMSLKTTEEEEEKEEEEEEKATQMQVQQALFEKYSTFLVTHSKGWKNESKLMAIDFLSKRQMPT